MKNYLTLMLLLAAGCCYAQNDCQDAIVVCGNETFVNLNISGVGVQELNATNASCASAEHNSLWLKLRIKTGGTLGFTIIPDNPGYHVDFDFFIFGPASSCEDIGETIRCSTTHPDTANLDYNHTGLNESETDTSEGPGALGNGFLHWLTVEAGETYYLVIDRFAGSSNFSLEWTGTAAFFDRPQLLNPEGIPLDIRQCDSDGIDDRKFAFDLTMHADMLIGNQENVAISYHLTIDDAFTGENPIANPEAFVNDLTLTTIYLRIENTETGCFLTETFEIEVVNPLVAGDPVDLQLCDIDLTGLQHFNLAQNDDIIKAGNPETEVVYYLTQLDARHEVNPLPDVYENAEPYTTQTIYARLESTGECSAHRIVNFTIGIIPMPKDYSFEVVDFSEKNSITVEMPDIDLFEFSIDGEHYSDIPVFENLLPGIYTIYMRTKEGCPPVNAEVAVLDYPRFFTPNGDGENETWRIPYLFLQPSAQVTIFDRYGRVITGFNGDSPGWDGTFSGTNLPSTDYWFVLQLDSGRIIKGHFAMIR